MSTTAERQPAVQDPLVEPHSERAWRRLALPPGPRRPGAGARLWRRGRPRLRAGHRGDVAVPAPGRRSARTGHACARRLGERAGPAAQVRRRWTRSCGALSTPGNELIWVLAPLAVLLFLWQRRWGAAVLLVLVTVGAQLLNDVLKARLRPRADRCHMAGGLDRRAAVLVSVRPRDDGRGLLLVPGLPVVAPGARRLALGRAAGLAVLLVLVGISRIYLEAHYLTDVLAGFAAGPVDRRHHRQLAAC